MEANRVLNQLWQTFWETAERTWYGLTPNTQSLLILAVVAFVAARLFLNTRTRYLVEVDD